MKTSLDKLREMPELAREALLTYNAPSRTSSSAGRKTGTVSSAPTDITVVDALNPSGHLSNLKGIASAVWDYLDGADVEITGNARSWYSVCHFLAETYDQWHTNAVGDEFIEHADRIIREAYGDLKKAARAEEHERIVCTRDGCDAEILSVRDTHGNIRTADECMDGHAVDATEFAKLAIESEELSLKDIAQRLDFAQSTLYRWAKNGELECVKRDGSRRFYRLGDVAALIDKKRA